MWHSLTYARVEVEASSVEQAILARLDMEGIGLPRITEYTQYGVDVNA
jgi:hypothetical protein